MILKTKLSIKPEVSSTKSQKKIKRGTLCIYNILVQKMGGQDLCHKDFSGKSTKPGPKLIGQVIDDRYIFLYLFLDLDISIFLIYSLNRFKLHIGSCPPPPKTDNSVLSYLLEFYEPLSRPC